MADVVTDLTVEGVARAMKDLGLRARLSTVEGAGIPCAIASSGDVEFLAYIQEGQSLCFQAVVKRSIAGFTDRADNWNMFKRFAKAIPMFDGYILRFEANIKHGITRENLRALIRTFGGSVSEFTHMADTRSGFAAPGAGN